MAEKAAKTIKNTENIEELSKEQLIELVKEQKVEYARLLKRRSKLGLSFETPNNRKEMGRDPWDEHIATLVKQNIPYLIKREDKTILQNSGKPTHTLIKGDNFPALLTLYPEYRGKVDVIYIDPPYNTGNKDFIYNDRYVNTEDGYRHSMWLSFMARRLLLAQELLSETGVIFVSIDDNEQAYLKVLMDEIFGEQNFVANFIWKKGGTGKQDSAYAIREHEYVLVYSREVDKASFNLDPKATTSTSYNMKDEKGEYSLVRLDSKTIRYSKSLDYHIYDDNGQLFVPEQPAGMEGVASWRWSKKKVDAERDKLVFKGKYVYTKNYKKVGAKARTVLSGDRYGVTRTGRFALEEVLSSGTFSFPKPLGLLNFILQIASKKDSIVLDFFAGSGTTGHAVAELNAEDGGNRRCILVTDAGKSGNSENSNMSGNNENAVDIAEDITYERMRRVLTGEDWANPAKAVALNQNLEMFEVSFLPKAEQGMRKTAFELKMDLEDVFVDLGVDEDLAEIYAERLYNRWEKFAENDKGDLEQWD